MMKNMNYIINKEKFDKVTFSNVLQLHFRDYYKSYFYLLCSFYRQDKAGLVTYVSTVTKPRNFSSCNFLCGVQNGCFIQILKTFYNIYTCDAIL